MRVFSLNLVLIIIGQQSNIGVSGQATPPGHSTKPPGNGITTLNHAAYYKKYYAGI